MAGNSIRHGVARWAGSQGGRLAVIRQVVRATAIAWAFTRRGLFWTIYRDVVRGHMSNPHCECAQDRRLSERASRLRMTLEDLGPTFVKLGQFLSRRPDLLPATYIAELSRLQEETPPVPFAMVRRRLEEVCICRHREGPHEHRAACLHCRRIEGVFESLDPEPVACASLAQVHRAVYQGNSVAVKVLKPGVLDRLNQDLALLRRLRWFIGRALGVSRNMDAGEFLSEFRRRLLEEVNFENEALNIDRFRENHANGASVSVPAVYWDFDRSDLLVLEFVEGVSLRVWRGPEEEARNLADTIAEDFLKQVFIDNFFHADPHPGNLFVGPGGQVMALDFGTVGQLEPPVRRSTLALLRSILNSDSELAVDSVLELGGTDPHSVNREELRLDLDRVIHKYRRRGGRWTDGMIDAARRHGIRLPSSILLYAKATMLIESMLMELDPDFQAMPVMQRMIAPILEKEVAAFAGQLQRDLPQMARQYTEVLRELPVLVREYLKKGLEQPG
jgi:ubiquinone biosynthesis protein